MSVKSPVTTSAFSPSMLRRSELPRTSNRRSWPRAASTRATADYYTRLVAQFGQAKVDSFARYYQIAGLGHAVSSQFNATWDSLAALEAWVDQGTALAGQVTTDTVGVPGRTRPLCDYPKWPKYKGSGSVDDAASFTCVAE